MSRIFSIRRLAEIVAVAALTMTLVTTATTPAEASTGISCPQGYGIVVFTNPSVADTTWSLYWYRVNGGAWQTTAWFYSVGYTTFVWNGSSLDRTFGEAGAQPSVGTGYVEGWEQRYTPNGYGGWVYEWINMGSCYASSF